MSIFKKSTIKTSQPEPTIEQHTPVTLPPQSDREGVLRDGLVNRAKGDLGVRESDGKNRSPVIDQINREIGVALGSPYCIAGLLIRCVKVASQDLGLKNPVYMTASTQSFWKHAPTKYRRLVGRKGDIGIMRSRTDASTGHAYMLTEDQLVEKYHSTIEYNTNGSGARDGDGVYTKVRSAAGDKSKEFLGFVDVARWILDANE